MPARIPIRWSSPGTFHGRRQPCPCRRSFTSTAGQVRPQELSPARSDRRSWSWACRPWRPWRPPTERDRLELDLRVALGTDAHGQLRLVAPLGIRSALEPAFPLARRASPTRRPLGSILWGLWVHYQTRTDFPRAHAWLDELEKVARRTPALGLASWSLACPPAVRTSGKRILPARWPTPTG